VTRRIHIKKFSLMFKGALRQRSDIKRNKNMSWWKESARYEI